MQLQCRVMLSRGYIEMELMLLRILYFCVDDSLYYRFRQKFYEHLSFYLILNISVLSTLL